jgi:hypothetical protein
MVKISGIRSQRRFKAFVVLLRDTTWKCGTVERLVVNYLRRQLHCGCTKLSMKDILEHFTSKEKHHHRFLEAMERLERRGIIKVIFNPFSSADEFNAVRRQGGL